MTTVITNADFLAGNIYPDQTTDNPIVFFNSVLDSSEITTIPDTNLSNLAVNMWNPDTASTWVGVGHGPTSPSIYNEYIYLGNPNFEDVDCIAIAAHNFEETGVFIIPEVSTNGGSTYFEIDISLVLLEGTDSTPKLFYFDTLSESHFRIRIGKSNVSQVDAPIVGHVKMGRALVLQRREFSGVYSGSLSKNVKRTQSMSENGEYLGQVVLSTSRNMQINQDNNTPVFVRDNVLDFIAHTEGEAASIGGSASTFFYSWRPTSYPDDTLYGWTTDKIEPSHSSGDSFGGRMKWSLGMRCIT